MGFKFDDKMCVIEIESKRYPVVFRQPLIDRLNDARDVFASVKSESADVGKVLGAFDKAIDNILGDGSAAEIFKNRVDSLTERFAVLKYIYDEITAFLTGLAGEADVCPKK